MSIVVRCGCEERGGDRQRAGAGEPQPVHQLHPHSPGQNPGTTSANNPTPLSPLILHFRDKDGADL